MNTKKETREGTVLHTNPEVPMCSFAMKPKMRPMPRSLKSALLAALVAFACPMPGSVTHATGIPVVDVASVQQQIMTYIGQYKSWVETTAHYVEVGTHYAQQAAFWKTQLVNLVNLKFKLFEMKHEFKEIDPDFGIDDDCPGAKKGLSGLLSQTLDAVTGNEKNIQAQQESLCVAIVRVQNQQYNDTVKYIAYSAEATSEITKIAEELVAAVGKSPANAAFANTQIAQHMSNMESARSKWQASNEIANAHIAMLTKMQRTLSRKALNGSPGLIGTLVNVVALKAAFKR